MSEEIIKLPINYNELLSNIRKPIIFNVTPNFLKKRNIILSEDSSSPSDSNQNDNCYPNCSPCSPCNPSTVLDWGDNCYPDCKPCSPCSPCRPVEWLDDCYPDCSPCNPCSPCWPEQRGE